MKFFHVLGYTIGMWWEGLTQIRFFDTPFDVGYVMLFLLVFSLLVPVLGVLFGGGGDD